jgi:hypothetical protein
VVPFARSRLSLDTSAEPVLPFARPRLHFPVSTGRSRSQDHHCGARVRPEHPSRHYQLGVDEAPILQVMAAFDELAVAI